MKKIIEKIIYSFFALFLVLSFSFADAKTLPEIKKVTSRSTETISLQILYLAYAKKDVDVKVRVKNKTTMKVENMLFEKKSLDKKGKGTIKIENLTPGTKYSFKIKISKKGKKKYTNYSNSYNVKSKKS